MFGSVLNTLIGAGIKLGANVINAWIEQRMVDRQLMAARDEDFIALFQKQLMEA